MSRVLPVFRLLPGFFLATAAFTLGACASDTSNYPSLAKRDAERIAATPVAPAPVVAAPAPSAAITARLGRLTDQARQAHAGFGTVRSCAERLVSAAAGAAVASESWSVATVALAELESARSEAMIALADLDQIYTAERLAGTDVTAIAAARDEVTALVSEEDRALAALRRRMRD